MDFNKLTQQTSSFMNKQSSSSNQSSADPNMNTNTGGMSNTNDMSNTGSTGNVGSDTRMGGNMSSNQGMAGTNTNTGNEDYGDKGLDFLEEKTGHTLSRDQNEKITDSARGMFEKMTGKKVDPKYSN